MSTANIPLLALAYGLAAGSSFLLNVALGRALGAVALGSFAFAVAVARIFYAASDLGLAAHLTRTVSRDQTRQAPLLSRFVRLRASLIPVAVVITMLAALGRGESSGGIAVDAVVAITLGLVTIQGLYEAIALGHHQQRKVAGLTAFGSISVAAGTALWFFLHGTLWEFALMYGLTTALAAGAWWLRVRSMLPATAPVSEPVVLREELRRSWPIGVSMLLGIASLKAPIVLLGLFHETADVGAFAAIDMLVTASVVLQVSVTSATFPRLSATYRKDPAAFRKLYWGSNGLLAAAGLALGLFLTLVGGPLISTLFPAKDFSQVSSLMPIVGWSAASLLLVQHNILIFAAADREQMNLRLMASWFVIVVVVQIALIPRYGVTGAAWGLLIGRALGLAVVSWSAVATGVHRGGGGGRVD